MTLTRDLAWQHLERTYEASISRQVARYALGLEYPSLPPEVVHEAKRCLLDALGCAIGAYEAPGRSIFERSLMGQGGVEEATMFCSGLRTNATNAALLNSFLVRFLDFNDLGGGGHGSDGVASIFAVAERERSSGRDFLTALVISYELGVRFKDAAAISNRSDLGRKGWAMDIRAGFNQPPALGKLMGLDEVQISHAMGICMSHTMPMGILDCDSEENSMAKNLRFGWVAHDAILSCIWAKNGFTGPVLIMESPVGIRNVILHGDMDFEKLIDFSGWKILDVRFKTIAAHGGMQGYCQATLQIAKEQNLKPEDIASVRITADEEEIRHTTTASKKYPKNAESADHSLHYLTALAIKEHSVGADSVNPEKFADPVILDLIEKITTNVDPSMGHYQGACQITTKDGRRFSKRVDVPHGLGNDPLSDTEIEDKFREMARKHMSEGQIEKIFDACWNLEKLDDLRSLAKLMVFQA